MFYIFMVIFIKSQISVVIVSGQGTKKHLIKPEMVPSFHQVLRQISSHSRNYAAVNFCHNHPPAHPRGFAPKFVPTLGLLHPSFCPGVRGFVGVASEGRAFVYKRFLPFLEFPL